MIPRRSSVKVFATGKTDDTQMCIDEFIYRRKPSQCRYELVEKVEYRI